ncbi:MAG: M48 family metallopeptidase [Candidatus Hydrothermarchaeota archaeon]|nr:M48 family metallopeptidase [Candidatus Hydrothermarchaeota archaeon]
MERQVRIRGMDVKYRASRRDVCYPRLEFKTGNLLLVLPRNYKGEKELIKSHSNWIYEKSIFIKNSLKNIKDKSLLKRSDEEFKQLVYSLVRNFSKELKIDINKIFFRKMKSKWGSCSSRKNLTFHTFLKYLPETLIKYIVLHEMAHLIERKHDHKFWEIVSEKYKNHQKCESDLFSYWFLIKLNL